MKKHILIAFLVFCYISAYCQVNGFSFQGKSFAVNQKISSYKYRDQLKHTISTMDIPFTSIIQKRNNCRVKWHAPAIRINETHVQYRQEEWISQQVLVSHRGGRFFARSHAPHACHVQVNRLGGSSTYVEELM